MVKFEDEFFPDSLSIIPEPAVKGDLPAASLVFIIIHIDLKFLQYFDHVKTSLRIDLIYKTGDKNVDSRHNGKTWLGDEAKLSKYHPICFKSFQHQKLHVNPTDSKSFQKSGYDLLTTSGCSIFIVKPFIARHAKVIATR
jgi:hypothetical protein